MDYLSEIIPELVSMPDNIANLQFPAPELVNYYKDVERRVFYIEGDIDDSTLEVVKTIYRYNRIDAGVPVEERRPIYLIINSLGGDVQVMWSIINAIEISKTPVYTVVYCVAMSAAAHLLAAGHKRFAMPGTTILVHSGSCQYGGDIEKVESAKRYYDALSRKASEKLIQTTKILSKDLKKKGASDWYMSAEEALKYGIVDAIVSDFDEITG